MPDLAQHIDQNRQRYLDELIEYLKVPSISSSSAHKQEVRRAGEQLAAHMLRVGLSRSQMFPTPLHPIVYGEWLGAPGKPTVLIYGHYDVQPVDPLELWKSPPFEPEIRDGELYARGSVDDKGQIYVHLKAIEAHLKVHGKLPLNVKFIAEGEEEIGSEHLEPFMQEQAQLLTADFVVVSDTPMYGRGIPSICYGLRGLAYSQIDFEGPTVDLHSGSLGGIVANPVNEMSRLIAALKDADGVVQVPGFYDDVRALTERERKMFADLPQNDEGWRKTTGSPRLHGEKGYTTLERLWARPTLDVNGIWGGFSGEGSKTIIPSRCGCKVSMRLVPDQSSAKALDLLEKFIKKLCPPTVKMTFTRMHGGEPWLADISHPCFDAAVRALERAFGARAVYIREGGSIPFLRAITESTGKPCLLLGFGLPDENEHATNEKLNLENYQKGILAAAYLYEELAR